LIALTEFSPTSDGRSLRLFPYPLEFQQPHWPRVAGVRGQSADTQDSSTRFSFEIHGGCPLQVLVRDNNVDQALRVLKKKLQREGVLRELKLRRHYEKPSERTIREKAEAIRRARKLARKQAIREGLIAAPKKKPFPTRTPGRNLFPSPPQRDLDPAS
jgi:small subunit ribosomal protein S21